MAKIFGLTKHTVAIAISACDFSTKAHSENSTTLQVKHEDLDGQTLRAHMSKEHRIERRDGNGFVFMEERIWRPAVEWRAMTSTSPRWQFTERLFPLSSA